MPRFYISDSARPGKRCPGDEFRKVSPVIGSDILNEAQAIARGRKTLITQSAAPPVTYTARYWRVIARSPVANTSMAPAAWRVCELTMWAGVTNYALSAGVLVSGTYGGAASNLKDGITTALNVWLSPFSADPQVNVIGQWAGYDFGVPRTIFLIQLFNPSSQSSGLVQDVDVENSSDGVTWNLVKSYTGLSTAYGAIHTFNIP